MRNFEELDLVYYILTQVKFCKKTNHFIWIVPAPKRVVGKVVGGINHSGYWCIKFRYFGITQHVMEHRLLWFVWYGELPDEIDHINGVRHDNSKKNLRSVDRTTNCRNLVRHRNKHLWGCSFESNAWRGRFRVGKKLINAGRYQTEKEAHIASVKLAKQFGIKF